DDLVPACVGYVAEAALRQVDAGAVHQDVDSPVALLDSGGGLCHLVLLRHVTTYGLRLSLLERVLQRRLAAARENDRRAELLELDRAGKPDAGPAAGDPGDFTGQVTAQVTALRIAGCQTGPPVPYPYAGPAD